MNAQTPTSNNPLIRMARAVLHWFDTGRASSFRRAMDPAADRIDWLRTLPFILMHAACLFAFVVGVSPVALIVCVALYFIRMFAITGFYHRYFSHKSFKTSRVGQFLFGVLGASAVQRGPIWWAAHHRDHHQYSDKQEDAHSPIQHGFVRAHMSWFLSKKGFAPDLKRVRDLMNFPELRWLDRFDIIVPVLLAVAVFFLGRRTGEVRAGPGHQRLADARLGLLRVHRARARTAPTPSIRCRTCSASSATRRATRAATTGSSR